MKYITVEECCNILDSQRIPVTASKRIRGIYPYYGANGLQDYVDSYIFDDDLILVAEDGGHFGEKDKPIAYKVSGKCWVNNHAHVLKPKENFDIDYVCYSLMFYDTNGMVNGATRKKLNQSELKQMKIPFVGYEQQIIIKNKINSIFSAISIKQNLLNSLNELIKSQFIEMFGNKNFQTKTMDDISRAKGEYGAGSASIEYDPSRPRYVRITDINDDGTLNNDCVSSINVADDSTYKLEYGDFMFARMGATVGKTYAFFEGNEIFAGYLIRYRLNTDIINPRFLFYYTKTDDYLNWVKENQSGAAQPGINAKKYGSMKIPCPPITVQNEFASFVEQIDKSKFIFYSKNFL